MKFNSLNKKTIFGMFAATAVIFASCSDTNVAEETGNPENPAEEVTGGNSNLTTVKLASFAGDPSRVTYFGTRAEGDEETTVESGTLELIASIANPSKAEGFNFEIEKDEEGNVVGRWLSATGIFYNETTKKYYISYHMQGNNYNTTLDNDIAGAIQVLDVTDDGIVDLQEGFRAENPKKEDYDFNHIYFDKTDSRILVVGHKWNVPSTWDGEGDYTGKRDNTRAIIGMFNPETRELTYSPINTAEKAYDERGLSLGYKDAGDANCVIRVENYPNYFVATRKGIAVLSANEENLFAPAVNEDGSNYFVPTPGSAKFVYDTPRVGSMMDILYLSEERDKDAELTYETSSTAKIAQFQTTTGRTGSQVLMNPTSPWTTYYDSKNLDILSYEKQFDLPEEVKPIDGKNAFCVIEDYEYYAPLGTNGLYYRFKGHTSSKDYEGVIKFVGTTKNLPVNCVYAEQPDMENGHDGFIYVACGARLVILHRRTLEVVAYWNIPTKDDNGEDIDVAASANYIHVEKAPRTTSDNYDELRERIITVAFGQEGVKVFKFTPAKKTVWEFLEEGQELPAEIKL